MNLEIKKITPVTNGYVYKVELTESGEASQHEVSLTETDYQKLSQQGQITPEELLYYSFQFLLTQESASAILPVFDLPVIGKYFPDYFQYLDNLIRNKKDGFSGL
jgi:hypothetical protein